MLFSHVVNPFVTAPDSEHGRAQRITFAALRRAVEEGTRRGVAVEVLGAVFPEDAAAVEPPARAVPDLRRRVNDVAALGCRAPYPLFHDILQVAAEHGLGSYVIFTNMDICPQPYFYVALERMIGGREDAAFVIPRRTISSRFTEPGQLAEMYAEAGKAHEGFDCFVFPRAWIGRLDLGALCIGIPNFDLALIQNLEVLSGYRTHVLWNQFLTFHVGDDKSWKDRAELNDHNLREAHMVADRLIAKHGPPPLRSKFEYASVWIRHRAVPPAPLWFRVLRRLQQGHAERRNHALVRRCRREFGMPPW
jgi:hypothetical protein